MARPGHGLNTVPFCFSDITCRLQPTAGRKDRWQSREDPRAIVVLMKTEKLISAGFAITALAAASVPALGWTLLGSVDQPPLIDAQTAYVTAALQAPSEPEAPVAIERAQPDSPG